MREKRGGDESGGRGTSRGGSEPNFRRLHKRGGGEGGKSFLHSNHPSSEEWTEKGGTKNSNKEKEKVVLSVTITTWERKEVRGRGQDPPARLLEGEKGRKGKETILHSEEQGREGIKQGSFHVGRGKGLFEKIWVREGGGNINTFFPKYPEAERERS